jgi:hypothetical protein
MVGGITEELHLCDVLLHVDDDLRLEGGGESGVSYIAVEAEYL